MKHEQKIKAVKDLQEEYDRRSEIEEKAFALLAHFARQTCKIAAACAQKL